MNVECLRRENGALANLANLYPECALAEFYPEVSHNRKGRVAPHTRLLHACMFSEDH
jgi:hypothetical protein